MARILISSLLILAILSACQHKDDAGALPIENSVYYWRTSWQLDSTETAFLTDHGIKRVFCRYFDVVMTDGEPMPNATIRFDTEVPSGFTAGPTPNPTPSSQHSSPAIDLVPTVYITEDCMSQAPQGGWPELAKRLVNRIVQMNITHDLPPARELQVDCDYTRRSRQTYYDFLNQVRSEALRHGMKLSTTIRLHQLSMSAPPADYGVLMVYNTGDPQNFAERNPILDIRDVQPYMRYLADYPLPLAAAYPVYRWQRSIGGVRIEHSVEASEILAAKTMIERERPDMGNTILIYCLDKENINRYDNETFRKIYHR